MKHVVIAIASNHMDSLFIGIREFPTERIILLALEHDIDTAHKAIEDIKKFNIPVRIVELKGDIWLECFRAVAEIKKFEDEDKLLINVATVDCPLGCALTSAAFVNGIKAFTIVNNEVVFLPILKFSYYKMLTDRKMEILKTIYRKQTCCASLEELGRELKMSLPLVSYHINGTPKSDGLKKLGLIETTEKKGRIDVKLSTMGRLIVKGYVD
ncbi:MAG: hypothetical protein V1837_00305 [Candidatus Woesearchaeota archaeon]